ncbi:MAG TPA: YggS family pyridoxal phosphate-dependent enzyme [Actinomycetota bacterium]|nr:YggS family pyridoxal phosphate-dependent enzyme [Actinomycetota bacterium]
MNEGDSIARLEEARRAVEARIAEACGRSARDPEEVTVVAVTKGFPPETAAEAVRAGFMELGENYVQELVTKRGAAPEATWHLVGRLQRNKVGPALEHADVIHTLEPGSAVGRVSRMVRDLERTPRLLVEVDFAVGRVGVPPNEAEGFVRRLHDDLGLAVRGLMTVAPLGEDPRPTFAALRRLRDALRERYEDVVELSMGMSIDLEAAVEEGATMVRVGTAIFGPRPTR